jgi:hypothetical protein
MKSLLLSVICSGVFFGLTGCATVTGERSQQIRVETFDTQGAQITGAKCKLVNDYGEQNTDESGQATVHRSNKDILVECNKAGYPAANAVGISRANAGIYGNIIIGGGIGALIDLSNGSAYTYPKWLSLVFGQTLTFDRSDDKDGQRSVAIKPDAPKIETGNQAKPSTQAPASQPVVPSTPAAAPSASVNAPTAPVTFQTIEFRSGVSSTSVEKIAQESGCNGGKGAALITEQGPVEVYRMQCNNGKVFLAKCELRQCNAMR